MASVIWLNYCGQVYTQVHRGQHYGYGVGHMVKDHSDGEKGNRCRHMGYSCRLTARVILYAPSHTG